jgi:hypothetical protein
MKFQDMAKDFYLKFFLENFISHKEWTITIDLKQWHPMLYFELNYYCNVTQIELLLQCELNGFITIAKGKIAIKFSFNILHVWLCSCFTMNCVTKTKLLLYLKIFIVVFHLLYLFIYHMKYPTSLLMAT